tara:strand:+ start:35 stop:289 length:255 start_codon:yes stop_codon:yes gene_type:complete
MKFTIAELKQIIKEEMDFILNEDEQDAEKAIAAMEKIPQEARELAGNVRKQIVETATTMQGLDPMSLASIVAGLISADGSDYKF